MCYNNQKEYQVKKQLNKSIQNMIKNIKYILNDNLLSIYIYGSLVLNDFKLGWSDIDILVLTKEKLDIKNTESLLYLRQELLKEQPNNKYYRSFEGGIISLQGFLQQENENVVYWGTKGERIKEKYVLDSFSMKQLLENSKLVYGLDVKSQFKAPTYQDLYRDVQNHYNTIREHAQKTGRNLYSYGWFLDISRCIYTLKTGEIIAKTKAGTWALKNNLCPDKKAIKRAIKVRNRPYKLKNKSYIMDYAETLGQSVQRYVDVLEKYLNTYKSIKI